MTNKPTLRIMRGLPGSGKSTEALKWVSEDPGWRNRVNRDDLRFMTYGAYSGLDRFQEENITHIQHALINHSLMAGRSVVDDNVNLRASYVKDLLRIAEDHGAVVEFHDVETSVEDCITNDLHREKFVGEEVIRSFASRYVKKGKLPARPALSEATTEMIGKPAVPRPDLPKAVWVDVDGTIASMEKCGRKPFDWDRVGEDEPIPHVIDAVNALRKDGFKIVIMSGRDDVSQEATVDWLKRHDIEFDDIFMRRTIIDKGRRDNLVKHDLYWDNVADKYDIRFALDDRNQVVEFTRNVLKIPVFQVAPGNF